MKKITYLLSSVILVIASGCGVATDKSAVSEEAAVEAYARTIDSTAVAISEAETLQDFERITKTFAETARNFANNHTGANVSKPTLGKVDSATFRYKEAVEAKIKEIAIREAKNYKYMSQESEE